MKPKLSQDLIDVVKTAFKGKRLEKLEKSIRLIEESLEVGSWIKGASRSADTGFSQGLTNKYFTTSRNLEDEERNLMWDISRTIRCGVSFKHDVVISNTFNRMLEVIEPDRLGKIAKLKLSAEQVTAWVQLCQQKKEAIEWLDSSRPLPVITDLGTSPKVKATLLDMNLDLSQSTIKYPELERHERFYYETIRGRKVRMRDVWYTIVWEEGILHHQSRFSGYSSTGCPRCDACGKSIPSGRLVPLEGKNKDGEWMSILAGTDCAKTLFGVKDVGIKMEKI